MKLLDFEAHFYTDYFTGNKEISKAGGRAHGLMAVLSDFDGPRLQGMDENGITAQALAVSSGLEVLPTELGVPLARRLNDTLYDVMNRHPGRFMGYAALPVNDVDASVKELERCVRELGFLGWSTFSNYVDTAPDDPKYLPIFQAAEELGVPVFIHPAFPTWDRFKGLGTQIYGALGYTLDTILTVSRMICSGLLDRCPGLQLMMGHLGEGLPLIMNRIDHKCAEDNMAGKAPAVNKRHFEYYFRNNIMLVCSGYYSIPGILAAMEAVGPERIVFGTDFPYEKLPDAAGLVRSLPLDRDRLEGFCFRNAEALFPHIRL